jgi:hypothetical protein
MANVLQTDKQIAIIANLAEGSSIRSIERMTGVHRDTIMRLGVKVRQGCTAFMEQLCETSPAPGLRWMRFGALLARKIVTFGTPTIRSLATFGRSALSTRIRNWFPITAVRAAIAQEFRNAQTA